jgi:integrase
MRFDAGKFESWLFRKGLAKVTVKRHLLNLRVLDRLLENWSLNKIDCLITDFITSGKSNATVNNYIDTIRLLARCFELPEEIQAYKHLPKTHSLKSILTTEELEKILYMPCPSGFDKKVFGTDTLFLKLCCMTGARLGEIANLKKADVGDGTLAITHTKTGYPRVIPYPDQLRDELYEHMKNVPGEYVFVTRKGSVYSDHNWLHMWKRRLELAGIKKTRLTPYSLRHSYITQMLRLKIAPSIISKNCGNSPVVIYNTYSHMFLEDVIDAMKQHPLVRKSSNPKDVIKQLQKMINDFKLDDDSRFGFSIVETDKGIEFKAFVKETAYVNPQ